MKSVHELYRVMDTVHEDNAHLTIRVSWMDSLIEISRTTSLAYDLEVARKFRRDSTYIPTVKDTTGRADFIKIGSQNCHSYALERYFSSCNIMEEILFTEWTVLKENRYMNTVLFTAFKREKIVETKPKRNLNQSFKPGSILVFRNKWHSPIHSVFYDGQFFHSKYGAWPAKSERSLISIVKIYWDTVFIEEYSLDEQKTIAYLQRKK